MEIRKKVKSKDRAGVAYKGDKSLVHEEGKGRLLEAELHGLYPQNKNNKEEARILEVSSCSLSLLDLQAY